MLISIQQMRAEFAGSLAVYLLYFVRFCFWNRWLLPVATTFYTKKIHFRSCLFCVAYNRQECWQSVLAAVLFLKHFGFSSDLLKYKEKNKKLNLFCLIIWLCFWVLCWAFVFLTEIFFKNIFLYDFFTNFVGTRKKCDHPFSSFSVYLITLKAFEDDKLKCV